MGHSGCVLSRASARARVHAARFVVRGVSGVSGVSVKNVSVG